MKKPAVAVVVMLGLFLGGCAGPFYMDAPFREALRERESASARLVKALALYCALTARSLDARHQCIVEHRLLPFHAELGVPAPRSSSPAAAVPSVQLADRAGPSLVTCRRLRAQTTCRRADSLFAHFDGGWAASETRLTLIRNSFRP